MPVTEAAEERPASDATPRLRLSAWLRGGSFGPTDLTRRGCLLVLVSISAVLIPVLSLTMMAADAHFALKVWILAITVIAVLGAVLRVIADVRPDPQDDLDRAGKAIGAVAALSTALAVIIDWSLLHL